MSPNPPREGSELQALGALDPHATGLAARRILHDWLALQRAFPLRPALAREALAAAGDPGAAVRFAGRPRDEARLARDVETLARVGAIALPIGAPAYPPRLAALPDAPPLLFVRGDASALLVPAIAVVGARAPTGYGRGVARAVAGALARAGLVVVSGLALGIDAEAHAAALDAGGLTVAVQACGPERVYPASHRTLARRIADSGAVVTEFPPGTPPLPHHFPLRNRLISGLAQALVVVEARERSGSLTSALHAAEQGRDVFAVPGPIGAPTSAGTNRLLRDGAFPLLEIDDVLLRLGLVRVRRAAAATGGAAEAPRGAAAAPRHAAVLRALRDEPATRDALGRRLGLTPPEVALVLLELELEGLVVEERDGRLHAARSDT